MTCTTEQPAPSPPVGFQPEKVLGEGSSAVVWLARHASTGQDVVVKVWRWPLYAQVEQDRFLNECRWHAQLSGEPHIVEQVWASQPTDPTPWTATRAAGVNLTTWLQQNPSAPYEQRLQIADGLLKGLAALHRRSLIHRDINPNNILIDHDGTTRLCDLGLVLPIDRRTVDPGAGTLGFVAPELDTGLNPPSFTSDVYSAAKVIADVLGADMSPDIEHLVITRALSERISDRPTDASDFQRKLAALSSQLDDATPPATDQHAPEPDTIPIRHRSGRHRRPPGGGDDSSGWYRVGLTVLVTASLFMLRSPLMDTFKGDANPSPAQHLPAPTAEAAPSFPGEDAFQVGKRHPAVSRLDQALIRLGCTKYNDGNGYQPSRLFTEYTRQNVRDFQLINPNLAGAPDGYPGPRTWAMLFDPGSMHCS